MICTHDLPQLEQFHFEHTLTVINQSGSAAPPTHWRAHIYNMVRTVLLAICLHSALLHLCNHRVVSWHVSYNLQIQYSEGIQKSRFSNSFLQLRFENAQVILAFSRGSNTQISFSQLPETYHKLLLKSPHFSSHLGQNKSVLLYN